MLRALVVLLIVANGAFFAWSKGAFAPAWPAPRQAEREPQRLAAQLNPELVTVLPPQAASAAVSAARAAAALCLQAGPFVESELVSAEAALTAAQLAEGSWTREPAALPPPWTVFAGRWPDAAARRAREAELERLGLRYERLAAPAELAPGLVLSRHTTRDEAEAALAQLAKANPSLRGARVLQLPASLPPLWLRVAKADADVQQRLKALPPAPLGGGFKRCAASP
jgi:hypothetical protein